MVFCWGLDFSVCLDIIHWDVCVCMFERPSALSCNHHRIVLGAFIGVFFWIRERQTIFTLLYYTDFVYWLIDRLISCSALHVQTQRLRVSSSQMNVNLVKATVLCVNTGRKKREEKGGKGTTWGFLIIVGSERDGESWRYTFTDVLFVRTCLRPCKNHFPLCLCVCVSVCSMIFVLTWSQFLSYCQWFHFPSVSASR